MKLTKRSFVVFAVAAAGCLMSRAAVYNIVDYGAVSDTTRLSTQAIQRAIDSCTEAGGGTVLVPAGSFKTGSIFLRDNVTLNLENGATLYGSTDIKDYTPVTTGYVSLRTVTPTIQLIYADGVSHVAVTGQGTIDGRGSAFPKLSWNDEGITRPHLLRFICCSDVSVEGVTLRNSGCWMQHYLACDRVRIDGITVFNRNNYNNDALDLDGCHNVTVSNMIADSDDDGITLKSTSPRLCEDITISNCVISSHCNAIKLGTETNGGFRNIIVRGITVKPSADQSSQFFGFPGGHGHSAISLEIVDGGTMSNVDIADITIRGTESPIFIRLADRRRPYSKDVPVENVGSISGVRLHDILIDEAGPGGSSITGVEGHPVRDIELRNITIRHKGGQKAVAAPTDEKIAEYPESTMWGILPAQGFWLNHTRGVIFDNVRIEAITPDARPLFVATDSEGFVTK
ncbi:MULTISPECIES: glycoside hydrolase family 28 protein [Duncaniella]|uniref:glycoside hydrolase family 28 protein n=1 Tax=Duncaniella TaxID=2518495 RepID=UPI0010A5A158|nr:MULTISPECIES: glycosyl hydrolase family 28 protein [Duncaniella]QCD38843.1 glycoside hydrolase [Duncaniella sp. C9]QCP72532.1 glycoside hydrolase [Duncaniella sp. B8]